ncbi:MAG: hypothetical protein ACI8QZ_000550 [Chlamydiales bacterium]|jgi:hypothetical protein
MIHNLLIAAALLAPQVAKHKTADTVKLSTGKEYVGRVVYEDESKILMRVRSKPHEFDVADVAAVQTLERSQRELFARLDGGAALDASGLLELADFAAERGLVGEARMLYAKAIFADAESPEAFEALDGREHKQKGWQVKIGKRWKTLPEIRERHGKWKEHFEVETTHFIVRSDMPAERVVDLALDVERYYLAFYDVLGARLNLHAFDALPTVNAYEESGRMPKPPTAIDAWYAEVRNEFDISADGGVNRTLIAREMTRLMLSNSLRKTFGKAGNLTPWAARGIADMFASAVLVGQRPMAFDFTRVFDEYFRVHAQAKKPVSIKRLLTMGNAEFWGQGDGSNEAAAYTLVHFMIHGQDGKWSDGFRDFLESSYNGKGSATHFEKALGLRNLKELEESWNAYVKAAAGV